MVWKSHTVLEEPGPTRKNAAGMQEFGPAGAAVAASPTIDVKRNVLYVATGSSASSVPQSLTDAVVAFALEDGKLRWVKQLIRSDAGSAGSGFTSSPILRTLGTGNQILLAGQRSGLVYGLDPDHGGEILWQTKVAESGGVIWGSAADYRSLYVATSGPQSGLMALDLKTGAPRWFTASPQPVCSWGDHNCQHGQAQAVTVMPGAAFSGSLDGHLRAYSTINGKILWDFDTAKEFQTKNGVKANGGPLDHGGATIVNGVVYVNSGNALLAFSVDGK
jgi:polyvinyl alcohol dehydrogenase (cytochrome)